MGKNCFGVSQAWAGYLEGDNISTKIGSSRVEIGEASPIFQEIGIGEALVKSRVGGIGILFERSRDKSG